MFQYLEYRGYDTDNEFNSYWLGDACIQSGCVSIISPHGSPSLQRMEYVHRISNPITVIALIKYYESINRNVAPNLAKYYLWLESEGVIINSQFIKTQLSVIENNIVSMKPYSKYYNNTIHYINNSFAPARLSFKFA